jgi:4,5:9,10-diseco-3-hydroxy-5,9,17-trioxoandrosta-1(10),2-diene-4-oate hydrolase
VILIHGLGGYIENWEKNIAHLSRTHQVFALDLPGFGRSDKPDNRYTIPYWAAFVQKFMQALEIDRASLVGESMGGAIAIQFALQYPQQVERLILCASAGLGKEVAPFLRLLSLPILGEQLSRPSRTGSEQFWKELI